MANPIPNSVIGAAASVIAAHHFSHSKLDALFMESGAPGDVPGGNCEAKCTRWLRICNDDPSIDALAVLGRVIQSYMDENRWEPDPTVTEGRQRIREALARNQLEYQLNGYVTRAGASLPTKTLIDYLRAGDLASVEAEFTRAVSQLDTDPHASITAASSIIEATCKCYIETHRLGMPSSQTISPLWRVVQAHLGLNLDRTLEEDQKRVLQGLASIVDGVGSLRTHIGSAHGRGLQPPRVDVPEARLAVNAAHTLVTFIIERWHSARV